MKTNLGYKIRRVSSFKDGEHLNIPMKCFSCSVKSNGGWSGDHWWVSEGCCDGFIRAVAEKKAIVECDGYKEQVFEIPKKIKERLRDWIDDYCYETLEGQHNITQQSDNWFAMELEVLAGLIYALEHRKAFNDIQRAGRNYLNTLKCCSMEDAYNQLLKEPKKDGEKS